MGRFEGKVAIVTGGASGIGAASVRRFADEGAKVVIADIDDAGGAAIAAERNDENVVFVHADVSAGPDWDRIRKLVEERWGRLDVLHSNAFVQIPAPAHLLEESQWDRIVNVNLKSAYLGARTFVDLLTRHQGSMVLTSSVNALVGRRGRPAYAASKAGLSALGRQLAVEYGPDVRVNTVIPGAIFTPPWQEVSLEHRQATERSVPAKRLGWPEEVAAAVAFLASSEASYITGADLVVDGGWTIAKESQ
jgi:NAD(P)-dependent dehydrogenase (short-subunit alcohol dehydrogenase family)